MPVLYLSTSLQASNTYVKKGDQKHIAGLIADNMIPFLQSSGIQYIRGAENSSVIPISDPINKEYYGLHLALQSKPVQAAYIEASEETNVYYYPGSANSQHAAYVIAKNLKNAFYNPEEVKTIAVTSIYELRRADTPAVLLRISYKEQSKETRWTDENISHTARTLVQSLSEYFGIPFVHPQPERVGIVGANTGLLNIRSKPNTTAVILAQARKGQKLKILGKWKNWYVVNYNGTVGYAKSEYIK